MRSLLCVVLVFAAGCRCERPVENLLGELALEWKQGDQLLTSREGRYDFGRVATGAVAHLTVPVKNLGAGTLELTGLERTSGSEAFTLALGATTAVPKGGTVELDAVFTPTAAGALTATFLLTASNSEVPDATITLVAEAADPPCMVPSGIDFGGVAVGDTVSLDLELTNPTDTVRVAAIGVPMGTGASGYAVSGGSLSVPPHGSAKTLVRFSPTELRTYTAQLGVRVSADCPQLQVALTGKGVDQVLSWAPTPLDLGYVPLSATSTKKLTFTNLAPTAVTVSNLRSGNAAFIVSAPRLTVPSMGTAEVTITFAPRALGGTSGMLLFDTTLMKQPSGAVPLTGFGGGPEIDVQPASLSFGRVAYFPASPGTQTRRLTVSNVGTLAPTPEGNLHLTGMRVEVAPAGEFTATLGTYDATGGVPAVVGGNRVEVVVSLTPTSTGLKEATVTLHSNDFDEPSVTVRVTADVVALPPCNLRVTPTTLAFGVVSPPALREQSFTLTNLGANPGEVCLVSALELRPTSDSTFSLPGGAIEQLELQPGQTQTVKVRAWPMGARPTLTGVTGDVDFFVSSPTPTGHVALTADVGPSCIVVSPDEAPFGTVKIDCSAPSRGFNIYNTCQGAVALQSLTIAAGAPEFALTSTPAIPAGGLTIPPGGSPVTFSAAYRPVNLGPDEGLLAVEVTVNGVPQQYLVRLAGTGDTVGRHTDVFRQGTEAKADILLAIDGSCSMQNKQMALASNTQAFFQYAQTQGIDYHVAVLKAQGASSNTSVGHLTSGPGHPDKVLTPTTTNVAAQFAAKVQAIGASGGDERCFEPVLAALSSPLVTAENAGFLRQDASLAIICITDDLDLSPQPVPFYYSALANIKGSSRLSWLTVNAIAGFNNPSCLGGSVDNGRYAQMVTLTGGVKEEICTPSWSTTLQSIARSAFGTRGTFFLTAVPDQTVNPITVKIDGVATPQLMGGNSVWSYDASANAVVFGLLYQPAAGANIEVTYDVECL